MMCRAIDPTGAGLSARNPTVVCTVLVQDYWNDHFLQDFLLLVATQQKHQQNFIIPELRKHFELDLNQNQSLFLP